MDPNNSTTNITVVGIGGIIGLYLLLWATWNIVIAGKLWQEAPVFTWLEAGLVYLTMSIFIGLIGYAVKQLRTVGGLSEDYWHGVHDGMEMTSGEQDENVTTDT